MCNNYIILYNNNGIKCSTVFDKTRTYRHLYNVTVYYIRFIGSYVLQWNDNGK